MADEICGHVPAIARPYVALELESYLQNLDRSLLVVAGERVGWIVA